MPLKNKWDTYDKITEKAYLKNTEYTIPSSSSYKSNIKESTEWPPGVCCFHRIILTSGLTGGKGGKKIKHHPRRVR